MEPMRPSAVQLQRVAALLSKPLPAADRLPLGAPREAGAGPEGEAGRRGRGGGEHPAPPLLRGGAPQTRPLTLPPPLDSGGGMITVAPDFPSLTGFRSRKEPWA